MLEEIDQRTDQWALACITWEMLLGRGPFVADEVAALLYQIINLDPHPLAPRVPGLPPAVESVLRQALSKRPTERFASMREFPAPWKPPHLAGRRCHTDAGGAGADDGATVGYGTTPVAPTPAPQSAVARMPRNARKPDDDAIEVLPRNRIKPIHAMVAAIGVLLLLGAFLLWRSGSAQSQHQPSHPQLPPSQRPYRQSRRCPSQHLRHPCRNVGTCAHATRAGGLPKPLLQAAATCLGPTGEPGSSPRAKQWHDPSQKTRRSPGHRKQGSLFAARAEPAPARKPQRPNRH